MSHYTVNHKICTVLQNLLSKKKILLISNFSIMIKIPFLNHHKPTQFYMFHFPAAHINTICLSLNLLGEREK